MAAEQAGNTNATRSGSADVIVVGAGLAGLSAARALAAGGAAPIVLEARDRVGGKTDSRRVGNAVFDLGAQWLGPGQERCYGLVREFGLTLFSTHCRGTKVLDINGRRSTYTGAIPSVSPLQLLQLQLAMSVIDRAAKRVPLAEPWTAPRAAKWDAITIEAWRKRLVWSRDAATVLEIALRTPFGAEASEMSMLHLLTIVNGSGGFAHMTSIEHGSQQDRIVESAHQLAMGLAAPLSERVVLNAPVKRIQQDADGITVYTDSHSWRAQYAIVALAPMLAGRIEYEPGLPPMRDSLTQRVPMGATIKCIALYERAFWREQGFSGEAVGDFGAIGVALDNSSNDGAQPALVGFIGGRAAREWSARSADQRRHAVLRDLARFFGPQAGQPTNYIEKDWQSDRWSGGGPVGVMPPGALTQFGPALRAPIGRLHWAGTETATEWPGYMEGAIESGERTARETLARL